MRRAILLLALVVGCGQSPKYCDDCRPIRELQAKSGKTAEDFKRLAELKAAYAEKVAGLASFDALAHKEPDLHPDCDCPCHLHVVAR